MELRRSCTNPSIYEWRRNGCFVLNALKTESRHDANFVVGDDKVGIMTTLGFQCVGPALSYGMYK